jgi:hypothetical protein
MPEDEGEEADRRGALVAIGMAQCELSVYRKTSFNCNKESFHLFSSHATSCSTLEHQDHLHSLNMEYWI